MNGQSVGDFQDKGLARPLVITIFNQKGGVAKTTTSVNLAVCLAAFGRRVVLVDLDSQSNATTNAGVTPPVPTGSYHLITGQAPFADCRRATPYDGLSLIGGSDELSWADIELALGKDPEKGMVRALAELPADVDMVIVDCPPAPGIVSVNALVAADAVVMPVMPSPHALDGLHKAWWNVNRVRSRFNHDLRSIHILLTMTEDGELTKRLSEAIIGEFGPRVLPVTVPRDNVVIEAAARDVPVAVLAPGSVPARSYLRVAELLLGVTAARDKEAAAARLSAWSSRVGKQVPASLHEPGYEPMPSWITQTAEQGDDATVARRKTGRAWKLGRGLLLILVGAVLGGAATLVVTQGVNIPLPW